MNFVILAGGGGTRLWPISRSSTPKQLAKLVSDVTMLEDTIERFKGLAEPSQLYISTNSHLAPLIEEVLPNFPKDHYIIEPEKRDTGPAMAFAATWLNQIAPDEPMAFISSDHYIRDAEMYRETFRAAETVIKETGKLLDIAITPTFPNVNLGYTKIGNLFRHENGIHFYEFAGHREKPDYQTAKKLLDEGNYLWHANYYMWTPRKFLEAYQTYAPEIGDQLKPLAQAIATNDSTQIAQIYGRMEKISIDYAIAERMDPKDALIIRGDFGWADLGSWDMLYEELSHKTDEQGNFIKADWHGIDTKNTLVYAPKDKLITTIGVSDMAIIDTPDALLITPMGHAPNVKKIVELLKEHNKEQYL